MAEPPDIRYPTAFAFLLLREFTLVSMSAAIEPLRMANRVLGEARYRWRTLSPDGEPVSASDGLSVNTDSDTNEPDALADMEAVIVCGGIRVERNVNDNLLRWLRGAAQQGLWLGSTCTGTYALAAAGLLDDHHCSVHWENIASLTDTFPAVHVNRSIYTIDRERMTCSGGTTPIDMMLNLIRVQCGTDVSAAVAEQFIYDRIRRSSDEQRIPLRHVLGHHSEKLVTAVQLMEANIREPIVQADLAAYVGVSLRQLQRLFLRYLHCTPSRYYLRIRLSRARELLQQTRLNLVEISSLTGFVSNSHFSKSYKEIHGYPPSRERRRPDDEAA